MTNDLAAAVERTGQLIMETIDRPYVYGKRQRNDDLRLILSALQPQSASEDYDRGHRDDVKFPIGSLVEKTGRSSWRGKVVGYYRTELTPLGYAIESIYEPGSVQIYPAAAIRALPIPVVEDHSDSEAE